MGVGAALLLVAGVVYNFFNKPQYKPLAVPAPLQSVVVCHLLPPSFFDLCDGFGTTGGGAIVRPDPRVCAKFWYPSARCSKNLLTKKDTDFPS